MCIILLFFTDNYKNQNIGSKPNFLRSFLMCIILLNFTDDYKNQNIGSKHNFNPL